MAAFPYKEFYYTFLLASCFFRTYLSLRQRSRYHRRDPPAEVAGSVDRAKFLKSQEYGLARSDLGFVHSFVQIAFELPGVALLAWEWELSRKSWALFVLYALLCSTIIELPFAIYETFVLEARFDFNRTTKRTFILDLLKSLVLECVLVEFLCWLVVSFLEWDSGGYGWLWLYAVLFVISIVFVQLYPLLIAPLFNKFDPLPPDHDLSKRIVALAQRLSFPLTKIFVMDASTRSEHSNAYFYGFFKHKRIVLYDTLLKQAEPEPICAIVAHEIGHYAFAHPLKLFILSQIHFFFLLFSFGFFVHHAPLYEAFGIHGEQPVFLGFLLFLCIAAPADEILTFGMNWLSRRMEYQADEYAVKHRSAAAPHALAEGLVAIHCNNLSQLDLDPLYAAYHASHPTLVERLQRINQLLQSKPQKSE